MSYKTDMHMHSWYSDGTMKPTDLVRMYKEMEYDIISLTDHDGVDGISEAVIAGEALQIKVIPGIELGCGIDFEGQRLELHLLGYHIDPQNPELLARLEEIRRKRQKRNERLLAYLKQLGYDLTWEELLQRPGQTYVGKPNFARAMRRKGIAPENMWELFDQVEKEKISVYEGIDLIRNAGGMAVLAHPMKIRKIGEKDSDLFWSHLDFLVRDLKQHGLKGMECYHPSADHDQALRLVVMAGKYHLHITEGSDFHGDEK